jgi:hypothetical protein
MKGHFQNFNTSNRLKRPEMGKSHFVLVGLDLKVTISWSLWILSPSQGSLNGLNPKYLRLSVRL